MVEWIKYKGYSKDFFYMPLWCKILIAIWIITPIFVYYIIPSIFIYLKDKRRLKYRQFLENLKLTNRFNNDDKLAKLDLQQFGNEFSNKEIIIIVLGDLGHSPRMLNHVSSFLKLGYRVKLCGYLESDIEFNLFNGEDEDGNKYRSNLSISEIKVIKNDFKLPYIIFGILKILIQIFELIKLLVGLITEETRYILIQNPPSIPLLFIICLLKYIKYPFLNLIIDWHNLNFTILNLRFKNEDHIVIRFLKNYEKYLSFKFSDLNLTVSSKLKEFLINEFKINEDKIVLVYDKPIKQIFKTLTIGDEDSERLCIINSHQEIFVNGFDIGKDKILITSTSFTEDEDFDLLIKSLINLEQYLQDSNYTGRIYMVITGKGPKRDYYMNLIKQETSFKKIIVKNVWLKIEEYPKLLKISDLGISLHYSSSGLDLPMKIVDLFGCGIPVISMNFPSISELVEDNVNGLILKDNHSDIELFEKIKSLIIDSDTKLYDKLKTNCLIASEKNWDDEWTSKLSKRLI
ncbi:hypothetical protein B5S33_g1342 [[Candida] boidinii]|nr:hypothetical protein B5S33_g1342 [[Candida] boidinii]